jgi:hypothetical protein
MTSDDVTRCRHHPSKARLHQLSYTIPAPVGRVSDLMPSLQPSFTPRRSGGRDENASHMTVELCACARAMDSSRGRTCTQDVTANPNVYLM